MTTPRTWTDTDLEQFGKLWIDGTSIKEMAVIFATTEGSIAHKRHRLKLPPRGSHIGSIARWGMAHRIKIKGPTPPAQLKPVQHPPHEPVTLWERTGCAFPVNDGGPFLFCNNPGQQFSHSIYCDAHSKIMVRQYA